MRKNQISVDTESRSPSDGDTHITPYPPPGAIEVAENQTHPRKNRGLSNGEIGTNIENRENENPPEDILQIEQSGEITSSRENENATGQVTEPPRGAIFRHTDSGWRLAVQRAASGPSEAESRSVFEMPPTYSEAG
ncbi:hypothetical protein PQX77_014600 [Marasmius sp. AFHP31]|nr:hypothetical protein PQX77_014600 [Marasmius sp. AFHP31]